MVYFLTVYMEGYIWYVVGLLASKINEQRVSKNMTFATNSAVTFKQVTPRF